MIVGDDKLFKKLMRLADKLPDEFARALYEEGLIELKEVKHRTPVDTGALRASEELEQPVIDGREISVRMVAGGPSAPYAQKVHDDLDAEHHTGQALYMSSVIQESQPYMAQRVAKRIDLNRSLGF